METTGNRTQWLNPSSAPSANVRTCGAKFFDLNKDPIVCPKCGTVFQGGGARATPTSKDERRIRGRAPAGVDVVSLDEVEAGEEKAVETVVEDIDVEDDDADVEDDTFLEEEEEDEDDVTNLIDGDIAPDEEALNVSARGPATVSRQGRFFAGLVAQLCGYTAARATNRRFAPIEAPRENGKWGHSSVGRALQWH